MAFDYAKYYSSVNKTWCQTDTAIVKVAQTFEQYVKNGK